MANTHSWKRYPNLSQPSLPLGTSSIPINPYANIGNVTFASGASGFFNLDPLGAGGGSLGSYANNVSEDVTAIKGSADEVNIGEAKQLVERILSTDIVPFVWGPPGLGKSTFIKSIAQERKWDLIDLRLSLLNPVDLRGLPVVDRDRRQAEWYPPAFLPKYNTKTRGILFLDELNLAPISTQSSAYQLILDKRVGEYVLPPTWKIIAAGNRETDRASVYKLSAPLANRFTHIFVKPDLDTWIKWALGKVRKEIIDFLTLRPALLLRMPTDSQKAFPSPRSWAFLSDLLGHDDLSNDKGVTPIILQQLVTGTIGNDVGAEFIKFINTPYLKEAKERLEKFVATGKITMPKEVSVRYALITAVVNALLKKKITKERFDVFYNKLTDEEKNTTLPYLREKPLPRKKE